MAAILPAPGRPAGEVLAGDAFSPEFPELAAAHQITEPDGGSRWDREGAVAAFYHDVPEALVDGAVAALRTQRWRPVQGDWPLEAYPDVPMRYVACADDRIMDPAWQVRMAEERLGVTADVLDCAHSPMLARPAELADLLQGPISRPG